MPICNGTWDYEHYTTTRPTFTVRCKLRVRDHMSAYVRVNDGVHYNDFDNGIRDASTAKPPGFAPLRPSRTTKSASSSRAEWVYVDVNVYKRTFTGLQYQEATSTGTPLGIYSTYGANAKGVDFTGT